MADPNLFRVKVLLNNFYDNYKSKSFVMVDRQWENVRQFKKQLTTMFQLEGRIYLTTDDGYYLPGLWRIIPYYKFNQWFKTILFSF